jgi:HAE1 family hydrophobic/amphiphilic exporter-1
MAIAALAVLGLKAYFALPAELNPRVDLPTLTVTTIYPGAGPAEMETQVTKPLEDVVGTVPGVKELNSSSEAGASILSIGFQIGTDINTAQAEVRARVDALRANLPSEARAPIVAKLDINGLPILYVGFVCRSVSLQQLRLLADNKMRPWLERVPGVATVQVVGGDQREVHVDVDNQRLAEYGLTIEDVVNSIKAAGHDVPGGEISSGSLETQVRLAGSFVDLNAIRTTQILSPQLALAAQPGPPSGGPPNPPVTVNDVAAVYLGPAQRTQINRIDGREGVSLVFTKTSDSNTARVVDGINKALDDLKPQLPRDIVRVTQRDDAVNIRGALDDVDASLILGALLAMLVILLFLHNLRGTLIVSLAIPTCIVGTFLVMWAANFTLNQMTLLALSLSVGILVDDSIVVLESITRHLRYGETPREAAFNGRAEIGFADITTTVVDVVVFVPIAFMGGIVGGFFKQFGLTIATATLLSLVVSFTVTPMLASRWYRSAEDADSHRGLFGPIERMYRAWEAYYRRLLRWALAHRPHVLCAGVGALALIFFVSFERLGFEFTPGVDQGQISVDVEMPPGTSLAATNAAAMLAERDTRRNPDVASVVTTVGEVLGGFGHIPRVGPQFAQISVRLKPKATLLDRLLHPAGTSTAPRTRSDIDVANTLRADLRRLTGLSGGAVTVTALHSVAGIEQPVEIQLRGNEIDRLAAYAATIRDKMRSVPGVLDPDVTVRSGQPEVRAQIDRVRAAQYGVPPSVAGEILRDSFSGNTDAVYRERGDEFPIRVQLRGAQRSDPSSVTGVIVGYDAENAPITLSDIATISRRAGPTTIERYNGERKVEIYSDLLPDAPLGNVQGKIQRLIDATPHPGIAVHWGGEAEAMSENAVYFASALILAIILVYIVMASLFNNLGTPFVIMFTLPMALIGALGALVLTHETMSLVSAIGIIMLVGLMGRNAILLLDFTNTLRARGEERNSAIEEAGATRLRPILMTTAATMIGMLPVAMRIGQASEVRAPMAIVVIGGLLVSSILTLVIIPVLYSLFDDWFGKRRPEPGRPAAEEGVEPAPNPTPEERAPHPAVAARIDVRDPEATQG